MGFQAGPSISLLHLFQQNQVLGVFKTSIIPFQAEIDENFSCCCTMLFFSNNFDDGSDGVDGLVVYKQTKWRSLHLRV